ncbi:MAG: response regulator transcription factor [Bifidobacteriaceae bacterium]|jgi:DNA-binding response OmpR family regulator|nr:response regulator transcription factor [Bifidobacteriaceae bacterium]
MTHILIVEDEERIAAFLTKGLGGAGYAVSWAASGAEALALARAEPPDLVLLDLGLADMDGMAVLTRLRAAGASPPVIILTARTGVTDTVAGLEGGADDYMTKPFRFAELLARIRLRLRPTSDQAADADPQVLEAAPVRLELATRRAFVDGHEVALSAREFALAQTLMRRPGQVFSRGQLLSLVWGYDHDPGSNVVDVYLSYLRRKLGAERIETVRGLGFRWRKPPASE